MAELSISELLMNVTKQIENDDFVSVSSSLQDFIKNNPQYADDRFVAELNIINSLIECKSTLKEWAYFHTLKLVYRYCEMRYAPMLDSSPIHRSAPLTSSNTIWWCWLQGLDVAPDLVKICYSSLSKLNRPIQIITQDNYSEFITLPEYVIKKWKDGIISNTHLSDILRLELLTTHGGTWIDSTVYCSDPELITDVLTHSNLFCYSFAMRDSISEEMMFDNWFLHCTLNSKILLDTKQLLLEYWKNEDSAKHYFIFHILFTIACRRHPEECEKIPVFSLEPCHILQLEMFKQYSEYRWKQIMNMSGIHKLSYKYDRSVSIKGTNFEHFLSL